MSAALPPPVHSCHQRVFCPRYNGTKKSFVCALTHQGSVSGLSSALEAARRASMDAANLQDDDGALEDAQVCTTFALVLAEYPVQT